MSEFDEIMSLKTGIEKNEKFVTYYKEKVRIDYWLTDLSKNSIVKYKDRTEYKKNKDFHRLNGPAIDYNDETKNKYYYKGILYELKEEWLKATIKELRRIKIKKLNNEQK